MLACVTMGVSVKVREWRGVVDWWYGYSDGVLVRVKWWLGVVLVCYGRRRWLLRRSKSEFTLEGIWIKLTVHHSWWLRVPRRPIRDGDDDNEEEDGDNGLLKKVWAQLFICLSVDIKCCFIQTTCLNGDWKWDSWYDRSLVYQMKSILSHFW